jgi:hypothetical protein
MQSIASKVKSDAVLESKCGLNGLQFYSVPAIPVAVLCRLIRAHLNIVGNYGSGWNLISSPLTCKIEAEEVWELLWNEVLLPM